MKVALYLTIFSFYLAVAAGQNVPNDPLWPVFVQALSTQTARSVQDIVDLGLSDPTIATLWAGYKANMPSYGTTTTTTTPPPLPDLYQTSYSFSSSSAASQPAAAPSSSDIYNTLQAIVAKLASSGTASTTSTSSQDIYKAYLQLAGTGSSQTGTLDPSLLQQYAAMLGQKPASTSTSSSTGSGSPDMSQLLQQYVANLNSQLLQQYSQTVSSSTPAPQTTGQLNLQLWLQQMFSQTSQPQASTAPSSSTPAANSTSAAPTFEQQLAELFPQFKNLLPAQLKSNASGNSSADATQVIFDTLLFGPGTATAAPPAENTTPPPSVPNPSMNLINPTDGQGGNLINSHVENVFKTKASREMGCRFLPELFELELYPAAPIDCIGKCPFPYVNAQRFGVYCLCCPPGVNDQLAGMMSLFRRASYLEKPLAVVS